MTKNRVIPNDEGARFMVQTAKAEVFTASGKVPARDGVELFWREWTSRGRAGTAILFVHGLGEHSGRYEDFGRYFASRGIPVLAYDHRGFGQSGGLRGHVDRFDDYIADLLLFRQMILDRYPGTRIVLAGHSMGGLIALAAAERSGETFAAVVVSGPALGLAVRIPPLKAALGKLLARIVPKLTMTNEIDPNLLARNPEVGRRYVADPHVHARASTGFFVEFLRSMDETNAGAARITIPTFILHGTADKLTSPEASRAFYDRLGDIPKAFRFMEGFYHELFQEDDRGEVFALIEEWLTGLGLAGAEMSPGM